MDSWKKTPNGKTRARGAGVPFLGNPGEIPNARLDPIFQAVIQSVDEAIMNSVFANEMMEGFQGSRIEALPHDEVMNLLKIHRAV